MAVTREQLLKQSARRYKVKALPPFGEFRLQSLYESEMRAIRESLVDRKGELIQVRASRMNQILVAACLVDDNGARLFTDADVNAGVMDTLDGAVLAALYKDARDWSGFASDGDWKAIEDAAKNSDATS